MEISNPIFYTTITLPLIAFLLLIVLGNKIPRNTGSKLAIVLQSVTFIFTCLLFFNSFNSQQPLEAAFDWFRIKDTTITIHIFIDKVSVLMLFTVNLVALLVYIFSSEYMREDKNLNRYYAYLGLFVFSMTGILVTSNLVIIYIFWELVGLSSYLLIGFWRKKQTAISAAKKAFIMNRVGDVGFLIGLLTLFMLFKTFDLYEIKQLLSTNTVFIDENYNWILLAGFGIFCAAIGKSAQLPLSSWLPDAMEGPTPVSALIHAATMVAAGVYLLYRCNFIFLPEINLLIAFIGAITAFIAAISALSQTDIKSVLAFSTISQLGYMVCAIGTGSPESGIFHLFTHAFFKAGLFLSAGAIIHALHHASKKANLLIDTQDMQNMGSMFQKLPLVAICYTICALALAGFPFFSGFLSKDAILLSMWQFALEKQQILYWIIPILGFITALLTAFYIGRQIFMIFGGKSGWRGNPKIWTHLDSNQNSIKIPLIVLASLSLFIVFSFNPFSANQSWLFYILKLQPPNESGHLTVGIISAFLAIIGIVLAWLVYHKASLRLNQVFKKNQLIYRLSYHFWYIDYLLVLPVKKGGVVLSKAMAYTDKKLIDKAVDGFGIFQVVLAHVAAWFDKYLVDGIIELLTWLTNTFGNILRKSLGNQLQSYISWAVFTTLLMVLLFVLN